MKNQLDTILVREASYFLPLPLLMCCVCIVIFKYFVWALVMGSWSGSQGALAVPSDWQVRVFWMSGLIDRQSDRLYISTIPLYGCMDRRSCCIPFFLNNYCPFGRTTIGVRIPSIIVPLRHPSIGITRALNFFRQLNCLGRPPDQNSILQELVGLQPKFTFNMGHHVSSYTQLTKHGPQRLLKSTCWLLLVRLTKVNTL